MKRSIFFAAVAALALFVALPLVAQAPKGWKMRVDRSMNSSDPDAAGAVNFVAKGAGFLASNPKAAVYWNPANTITGDYTLKGTFTRLNSTGDNEYYGLVFGGSNLDGPGQTYLYFMVTDDGTFLVKSRNGNGTDNVSEKTPSDAVKKPDASGKAVNTLEVRVEAGKVEFVVNGTVVSSMPRTGKLAKTDGIYGIRINHHLEVQVSGFGVTKA